MRYIFEISFMDGGISKRKELAVYADDLRSAWIEATHASLDKYYLGLDAISLVKIMEV
jgi:hypothetical protein